MAALLAVYFGKNLKPKPSAMHSVSESLTSDKLNMDVLGSWRADRIRRFFELKGL
jgi:hypothetical protein